MYQIKQKNVNTLKALTYIYNNPLFTIPELSASRKISYPTAKRIVDELILSKILLKTDNKVSTGGRGQLQYKLNEDELFSIGIKIELKELSFVVTNVFGDILKEKSILNTKITQTNLMEKLTKEFSLFLEECSEKIKTNIIGAGISFPGVVSREDFFIRNGVNFNIKNLDLTLFTKEFPIKFYLENEANCEIYSEYLFGQGQDLKNFLVISIDSGVGAGIYLSEKIYRGVSGIAGEVGHLTLYPHGNKCSCGSRGCLETYISTEAFKSKFTKGESLARIFAKYNDSKEVQKEIDEYLTNLAIGIRSILFPLNIENVIISGEIAQFLKPFENNILEIITNNIFFDAQEIKLLFSELKQNSNLLGAAMIPVSEFFNLL